MKQLLAARAFLKQAMISFKRGESCLKVIKLLKNSQNQLRLANGFMIHKHLSKCLEKAGPDYQTSEIIKSFKYRQT